MRKFIYYLPIALLLSSCLGGAAWSPDGSVVIYPRVEGDSDNLRPELWMLNLDDETEPALFADKATLPQWSADGKRIYYLAKATLLSKGYEDDGVRIHLSAEEWVVKWYALLGDDAAIILTTTGELKKLSLSTSQLSDINEQAKNVLAAALTRNGAKLIWLAKTNKANSKSQQVTAFAYELGGKNQLTQGASIDITFNAVINAPLMTYMSSKNSVAAYFGGNKLLFLLPMASRRRATKLSVPEPGAALIMTLSNNEEVIYLTTGSTDGLGTNRFANMKIWTNNRTPELLGLSSSLIGGRSYSPDKRSIAELTPQGLRISSTGGGWERFYPATGNEAAALAMRQINKGDPAGALATVKLAIKKALPSEDILLLKMIQSDAYFALDDKRDAALILLEAWLFYPRSSVSPDELMKRALLLMEHDRLLAVLASAYDKSHVTRARELIDAIPAATTDEHIAGLNFHAGLAYLYLENYMSAGKLFRQASNVENYPRADLATGLAGICFYLTGRDEFGTALIGRAATRFGNSKYKELFESTLEKINNPANVGKLRSRDVVHMGNTAWSLVRTTRGLFLDETNIELSFDKNSTLFLATPEEKGNPLVGDLPFSIGEPVFSPSGERIAFAANTDAVFVVDTDGKFLLGDVEDATGADGELPTLQWRLEEDKEVLFAGTADAPNEPTREVARFEAP